MFSLLKVWLIQVFTVPITCVQNDLEQAMAALMPQLSSSAVVTFPWDSRWDAFQARASYPRLAPRYTVVVEVATEKDVQTTVSLASRFNVPFLAVSGTHGWTKSLNKFRYGIQINMRMLNTTTISRDGTTAIVGGGTLQHEITRALFAKGKYSVTGLCECTSLAGPLLGGGHSMFQGQHGYALDNLVSARVVLADGELVEASAATNPDLFWALKGAGQNFGILTSLEVKVYDIRSNWTVHSFIFASEQLEALFGLINSLEEPESKRPANLAMTGLFARIPDVDPDHPVVVYNVAYQGTEMDAEPYAAQFKALGPISTTISTNVDNVQLYKVIGTNLDSPVCIKNNNLDGLGVSLPVWNLEDLRKAFTIYGNHSSDARFSNTVILLENYGMQGVQAVDSTLSSLAIEERRRPVLVGSVVWWEGDDEQTVQDVDEYLFAIRDALNRNIDQNAGKRHVYVNYAMGDEDRTQLYGYDDKLQKLAKLKVKWDPKNRFGFYNPVV